MNFQLTQAGATALSSQVATGQNVIISHIALGKHATPSTLVVGDLRAYTALVDEQDRFPIISKEDLGEGLRSLSGNANSEKTYDITEIGLYLDTNVLFAVKVSDTGSIFNRKPTGKYPVVLHIKFGSANSNITVVAPSKADIPSATSDKPGIFRLATSDEVDAKSDSSALTPHSLSLLTRTGALATALASTLSQAFGDLDEVRSQPSAVTIYKESLLQKYPAHHIVVIGATMYQRSVTTSTPVPAPGLVGSETHWTTYPLSGMN